MEAIIFDLDGTIIDTIDGIGNAANITLKKYGYKTWDRPFYVSVIGNGARVLISKAIGPDSSDENLVTTVLADFLGEYEKNWNVDLKIYDGIEALIDNLLAKGIKISINTNKPDAIAQKIVRHFFSKDKVFEIIGSRKEYPNKPHPAGTLELLDHIHVSPEKSFYIGDSSVDIQTAKNVGMKSVVCTWGYGNADEFNDADFIVNHPSEILKLV